MESSLSYLFRSLSSFDEVLSCIFSGIDAGVIVADKDRKMVLVNDTALELFGYSEAELIGQSTQILYLDPESFHHQGKQHFNVAASSLSSQKGRVIDYQRKNGTAFKGETLGGPIKEADEDAVFFIGIIKDVSKRLATENALNRLHLITSNRDLNFNQRVHKILQLGCEHFQLPIGIFSQIKGDSYQVVQAVHPEDALQPGTEFSLAETYCAHTMEANGPIGFHHAGKSEIHDHPCYKNFALEAYLGSPINVDGNVYGTLNFSSPVPCAPFTQQDIELARLFAQWLGHEIARNNDLDALKKAQEELQQLAISDALTGLYNRRYMGQRLSQEFDRYQRYNGNLSLALLDFDHFKQLNDKHGHQAGDKALQLFAHLAKRVLRDSDILARWGGEEFLIAFPEASLPEAKTVLQRLAKALSGTPLQLDDEAVVITVSAGLVILNSEDTSQDCLIQRADHAMYEAKALGRNQIHCA